MIAEISSLQHPLVKECVELRVKKSVRIESSSVLLMGEKMIRELARITPFRALITTREVRDIAADQRYVVTDGIMQKITGLSAPDGFAAIARLPAPKPLDREQKILILDRLSDPGNLGTLLRTARGLGWDAVLLTPETVDPFNDKALRASKGALFSLPYNWQTPFEIVRFLQEKKIHAVLADPTGEPLQRGSISPPFALILSHEGSGSAPWAAQCARKISIPMHNGIDSINVAASGAIFLYCMANV